MQTYFFKGAAALVVVLGSTALVACGSSADDGGGGSNSGGSASATGGKGSSSGGDSATGGEGSSTGGSGTSTGGNGDTSTSGIDGSVTVGSLSDADLTKLCEWYYSLYTREDNQAAFCLRSSILLSESEATLEEQRTKCAEKTSACAPMEHQLFMDTCYPLFRKDCASTVDAVETCLKDEWAGMRNAVAGVSQCSELTADDIAQIKKPVQFDVTACTAAVAQCPSFNSKDIKAQEGDPASVVACYDACATFREQCGESVECACAMDYAVHHKELCAPYGQTYYECAKNGTFDCSDDTIASASNECSTTDYLYCFANNTRDCVRQASVDDLFCKDAAYPAAYSCLSDSPQSAGCQHKAGDKYCCAN